MRRRPGVLQRVAGLGHAVIKKTAEELVQHGEPVPPGMVATLLDEVERLEERATWHEDDDAREEAEAMAYFAGKDAAELEAEINLLFDNFYPCGE